MKKTTSEPFSYPLLRETRVDNGYHRKRAWLMLLTFIGSACMYGALASVRALPEWQGSISSVASLSSYNNEKQYAATCPQAEPLLPDKNRQMWSSLGSTFGTEEFKLRAVNWLAGAVQVPTETFDDMGPIGDDSRWETFVKFHQYLERVFPSVHANLELSKVNTYGLLYVWKGADPTLKPVLLAAHQDVVPVEPLTWDKWTHPPFSGFYDGTKIWGRGSSDDKSGLVGILSSVESLLERSFRPSRTFVLAFGFDEEVSGLQGAAHLSQFLLDKYGEDAFAFIIDEGMGFSNQFGSMIAVPGIAEKGYIDVRVEVTSPGGHSSIPPDHTSIGTLSALLVHYEKNPYHIHLLRTDPTYMTVQCIGEHAKDVQPSFRKLIKRAAKSEAALQRLEAQLANNVVYKSLIGTTQAIDIIRGGVKTNALPEEAYAIVNHRISVSSSVAETKAHDTALLEPLAKELNLLYFPFEPKQNYSAESRTLSLSDAHGTALEPAPVTPTDLDAEPYQLLSGTIKATYNAHRSLNDSHNIIVSPGMMTGNTDTRYYWKLSKHIFRYNHNELDSNLGGIHTVDEHIASDGFVEMIRFFTTLILNADESDTL